MQGLLSMFVETQEQFAAQGIRRPTLVRSGRRGFVAAAAIGYYSVLFEDNVPLSVVVEPPNRLFVQIDEINDGQPHNVTGELDTIRLGWLVASLIR